MHYGRFLPDHARIFKPRRYCTRAAELAFEKKFGRKAGESAWREAVWRITGTLQNGKPLAVRTAAANNLGCEAWRVRVDGELVTAFYNPQQAIIVTVADPWIVPRKKHVRRFVTYSDRDKIIKPSYEEEIDRVFGTDK